MLYLGAMIPVRIVSLQSASTRREHCVETFGRLGIPFTFFDAIDGRQMSSDEVAAMSPRRYDLQFGRELSRGEIGCAASFRSVFGEIAKGNDEFVAVFEDDAVPTEQVKIFLNAATLKQLPPFDILQFDSRGPRNGSAMLAARESNIDIHAPLKGGLGCAGQVVTREGAQKIHEALVPLYAPLDNLIYREARTPGLRMLQTSPGLVTCRGLATTIGDVVGGKRSLTGDLRRKMAVLKRNIRSGLRFPEAWGLQSLLRLRPFR